MQRLKTYHKLTFCTFTLQRDQQMAHKFPLDKVKLNSAQKLHQSENGDKYITPKEHSKSVNGHAL